MFPGIDGFHWTVSHIVFLSLFFAVVVTIVATVASAAWRTAHDFRTKQAIELCWKSNSPEIQVSTDPADGNDQDGERQNQLRTKFSRHGSIRNSFVRLAEANGGWRDPQELLTKANCGP
jgi:hypothetical protein